MNLYGEEFWRNPTYTDMEKLYVHHDEKHGFLEMLGIIDCTVIAYQDLWIWHAFFGVSGMNNDVNVLRQSPLFNDLKSRRAPDLQFVANNDNGEAISPNFFERNNTVMMIPSLVVAVVPSLTHLSKFSGLQYVKEIKEGSVSLLPHLIELIVFFFGSWISFTEFRLSEWLHGVRPKLPCEWPLTALSQMDSDLNIQDDQWELSLDIDDSVCVRLTPVLRPFAATTVDKITYTKGRFSMINEIETTFVVGTMFCIGSKK
ncbi:ALP1-like protein [Tanacetum coccineum]